MKDLHWPVNKLNELIWITTTHCICSYFCTCDFLHCAAQFSFCSQWIFEVCGNIPRCHIVYCAVNDWKYNFHTSHQKLTKNWPKCSHKLNFLTSSCNLGIETGIWTNIGIQNFSYLHHPWLKVIFVCKENNTFTIITNSENCVVNIDTIVDS